MMMLWHDTAAAVEIDADGAEKIAWNRPRPSCGVVIGHGNEIPRQERRADGLAMLVVPAYVLYVAVAVAARFFRVGCSQSQSGGSWPQVGCKPPFAHPTLTSPAE
jgi:hypothetical protein